MWSSLALPILLLVILLYIPGTLITLSLGLPRSVALACSPLVSAFNVVILGVVFSAMGIRASIWHFLIASTILSAVVASVAGTILTRLSGGAYFLRMDKEGLAAFRPQRRTVRLAVCLVFYVIIASAVTGYFFHRGFESPDSFVQIYDNAFHLSTIKSMVESGTYSTLSTGTYLEVGASSINPTPGGSGFYPAAWHILAALIAGEFGISIPAAVHAANFVFMATVYPTGAFALFASVFQRRETLLLVGAFLPLAFIPFPWTFLYWGPLYSNLSAFCLVPAACALFIDLVSTKVPSVQRVLWSAQFLLCLLAIVFFQPNAVFTVGVFVAPFCMYRIISARFDELSRRVGVSENLTRLLLLICFAAFVVAAWAFFYRAGFMQGVVTFEWAPFTSWLDALQRVATLTFTSRSQPVLALLVLTGVLYTSYDRKYFWLTVSYAFAALAFIVDASGDGPLRHILTGFWYTDQYRVAAMAALYAIPIAALGANVLVSLIVGVLDMAAKSFGGNARVGRNPSAVISFFSAMALAAIVFWPNEISGQPARAGVLPPFGDVEATLHRMYSLEQNVDNRLTSSELTFVEEAVEVIPSGSVVINQQYDGSVFTYPLTGINLVYRSYSEACTAGEGPTSVLLRTSLNEYATNSDVRRAVEELNIDYVLVLDQGEGGEEGTSMFYREEMWSGIQSITDETPGFEVVLARDDMRLYKIVRSE